MMRAGLSAVLLMLGMSVPAMACASTPDPAWIKGLYDDGDRDDLIVLATSAMAATGESTDIRPDSAERGEPAALHEEPASSLPSVAWSRAPPVA
jgi:hypothetical protein